MNVNKQWTLGLCLVTTLIAGGWTLTHSAFAHPLGNALADDSPARPLRMFFSGQFGRLLELPVDDDVLRVGRDDRDAMRALHVRNLHDAIGLEVVEADAPEPAYLRGGNT